MTDKKLIIGGLFFIVLGILSGLMAAHYLKPLGILEGQIKSFTTASNYLFYNGLGFLALAALEEKFDFELRNHFRFISFGMILFAGSIFLIVLLPVIDIYISSYIWFLTPLGGFSMIVGWVGILVKYLQTYK